MYCLQIRQFVIVRVDACTEEQPGVSPVYYLGHIPEFDKVGLMLLVAGRNEAVDLTAFSQIRLYGFEIVRRARETSTGHRKPDGRTGGSEG